MLSREPAIDVLKVDIEGLERETVAAIRDDLAERIDTIYFESPEPAPLHESRFDHWFANETVRLRRRADSAGAAVRGLGRFTDD